MDRWEFQEDVAERATEVLAEQQSVILQLPTGGGKTHIAAKIVKQACDDQKLVWFICHRQVIATKAAQVFDQFGIAFGVVASGKPLHPGRRVQICMVGCLDSRLKLLPPPDLIVWDEAHHVAAKTWAELRRRFSAARHLGLTATPTRLDGKGLGDFFDEIVSGPSSRELIGQGVLAPYRIYAPTIPDLAGVRTLGGDYHRADLNKEMNRPTLVGDVIEHYQRLCPGARALAFSVSVKASQSLAERFSAAGIPARHIDARTSQGGRTEAIEDLRTGRIKIISNVDLLTEGFDLPAIDAVILLRPTLSLGLYRQMIGRGLRSAPGKEATVILDHAGLVLDHGLPDEDIEWTLERGGHGSGISKQHLRVCPECACIHDWALQCTDCGYIYGADERTVRHVPGQLRRYGGARVQGAGRAEIARRIGVQVDTFRKFVREGMPVEPDGSIDHDKALAWIRSRKTATNVPPLGYEVGQFENRIDFGQRCGVAKQRVHKWAAAGLPCAPNGWVHINPALEWVQALGERRAALAKQAEESRRAQAEAKRIAKAASIDDAEARRIARTKSGVTVAEFAEVMGLPVQECTLMIKYGRITTFADGSIDIAASRARLPDRPFESIGAFCRRVGVAKGGSRRALIRAGLPLHSSGVVIIEDGIQFVEARARSTGL